MSRVKGAVVTQRHAADRKAEVRSKSSVKRAATAKPARQPPTRPAETRVRGPVKGRKPAEQQYVLLKVEDVGAAEFETSTPMTKGEILQMLADEIGDEELDTTKPAPLVNIPKSLGAAADLLYTTRKRRLEYTHVATALKVQESALKDHLINTLPKSDQTGAAGKIARAQIVTEDSPTVTDWPEFYKHISKTKSFELLNRAVNRKSVKERWDAGKEVPGVGHFEVVKVSLTQVS